MLKSNDYYFGQVPLSTIRITPTKVNIKYMKNTKYIKTLNILELWF